MQATSLAITLHMRLPIQNTKFSNFVPRSLFQSKGKGPWDEVVDSVVAGILSWSHKGSSSYFEHFSLGGSFWGVGLYAEVFRAIFVRPWKKVSVSVRYLFHQPMDKKIKTWPLRFPAKETLIWRRHCSIGQSCCGMTSKLSIDWFLESSQAWSFFSWAFA